MRSMGARQHVVTIAGNRYWWQMTKCLLLLILFSIAVPGQTEQGNPKPPAGAGAASAPQHIGAAVIRDIDANKRRVSIQICDPSCAGDVKAFSANDVFGPLLKSFNQGSRASLGLDGTGLVSTMSILELPVAPGTEGAVLAAAFVGCFLVAVLITRGHPLLLILGEDNRYSNSKTQLALWFLVLIATYIATVWLRAVEAGWDFLGGVQIPENLALISGISVLTYGGAKAVTTSKVNAALAAGEPNPKPTIAPAHASLARDLVKNDTPQFDLGDFQMLIVTFVAVAMYLAGVLYFLSSIAMSKSVHLPDVDTTILATFGLGQGAYLTKKAAGNPGTS